MLYKNVKLPDNLKDETIGFMKNIIDIFEEQNRLNQLDVLSLYILAGNVDMFLICEEHIKSEGMTVTSDRGNSSLSPYVILQKQVQNSILSLLKETGLTTYSRSKLKMIDSEEKSPLDKLLNL